MIDLFNPNAFFEGEFSQTVSASDLIKLLNDCFIPVPKGNDDIDRLNNLLKERGLYKKLSNIPLPSWTADLLKREVQLDEYELMCVNRTILFIAFPNVVPESLVLDRLTGSFSALTLLFRLFEGKRFLFLNLDLKEDIKKAIKAILAIEDFEKNRKSYYKKKHQYKVFSKGDIDTLNTLLRKTPINVGVDFHVMDFQTNKQSSKSYAERRIQDRKKQDILKSETNLPDLRFRLVDQVSSFQNEESVREVLTYGLFYYTDQLMRGKFPRPRRCVCNNWYLAKKRTQVYCNPKCKDDIYGKTKEGKEVRRRASLRYRSKKKNALRHP